MQPTLHFDGPVWRPPYEATSQLLQVTAGCTWHRCKFCTLYGKQKFRMSPMSELPESQLYQEIQEGKFEEATEHERFDEMITVIEHLHIQTHILGRTVSNPVPFTGSLPHDRVSLLQELRDAKAELSEEQLISIALSRCSISRIITQKLSIP